MYILVQEHCDPRARRSRVEDRTQVDISKGTIKINGNGLFDDVNDVCQELLVELGDHTHVTSVVLETYYCITE